MAPRVRSRHRRGPLTRKHAMLRPCRSHKHPCRRSSFFIPALAGREGFLGIAIHCPAHGWLDFKKLSLGFHALFSLLIAPCLRKTSRAARPSSLSVAKNAKISSRSRSLSSFSIGGRLTP